jgi:hypothetical protein
MSIQDYWDSKKAILFDGIIFKNSDVLELSISGSRNERKINTGKWMRFDEIFNTELRDTEIDQIAFAADEDRNLIVACGDGGFGADGFVCLIENDVVSWFLFMDSSNPFVRIKIEGDLIKTENNLGEIWCIPLFRPQDVSISADR